VRDRTPVVLVVGADETRRMEMTRCLSRYGCRWQETDRGAKALEILIQETIDLVLMDADLPDMDGFDVTRVLKSQPALETLPIVLLSARVDRNRLAFGIQSGATDVLPATLPPESVVARLWDILQHRGFIPPAWSDLLSTSLRDALSGHTPTSVVRPRPN
jgi:CheY-like chemotaxis protein